MQIILGDCLEKLKEFPDNSVDSVVTDPPYELGFMGKSWDNTGIANSVELWKECLRVLKPGGHLLSFSGTRTYHRMASAIEDAGFEVRDMIEWVYGSGFPKSLNIGKMIDKTNGVEREIVGRNPNSRENCDKTNTLYESGTVGKTDFITKGTSEWEGWGTALKPAHEPIAFCRKPTEKGLTIAENCLKWGTGGINIDESRVEIPENDKENYEFNNNGLSRMSRPEGEKLGQFDGGWKIDKTKRETPQGRFPANIILGADENGVHEEVRECFPELGRSSKLGKNCKSTGGWSTGLKMSEKGKTNDYSDSGNASRFFKSILYYPKASKSERNKGCEDFYWLNGKQIEKDLWEKLNQENEDNITNKDFKRHSISKANVHCTVKSVPLMEYLIKMVTPKGGVVLDPFMGSGSTGVACIENGYDFIGIDMTPEYIEIAKARIEHAQKEANSRLF